MATAPQTPTSARWETAAAALVLVGLLGVYLWFQRAAPVKAPEGPPSTHSAPAAPTGSPATDRGDTIE